jgi:hypothetical protein
MQRRHDRNGLTSAASTDSAAWRACPPQGSYANGTVARLRAAYMKGVMPMVNR